MSITFKLISYKKDQFRQTFVNVKTLPEPLQMASTKCCVSCL